MPASDREDRGGSSPAAGDRERGRDRISSRLGDLPDRLLHPLRRWRSARALEDSGFPGTVLFVCLGNLCRSPYAEGALRRATSGWPLDTEVVSAGFTDPGGGSPEVAVEVARQRGVDLSEHVARRLTGELLQAADLVFVMDPVQRRAIRRTTGHGRVFVLGDLDPDWAGRRAIRDPLGRPRHVFREVYDRIDRTVEHVASILRPDGPRDGPVEEQRGGA